MVNSMEYGRVNPEYILEMEALSLMNYARFTRGARETIRAPDFYHTGYNYKYLIPDEMDACEYSEDCQAPCAIYHDPPTSPKCVTSSRIQDSKNSGEVWKRILGDPEVLKSTFYVVDTGAIDSKDYNITYSIPDGTQINIFLYYKLCLSKKTKTLYCIFSSGVILEDLLSLGPLMLKLIDAIAVAVEETDAKEVCVTGHSMGASLTVVLSYVWETSQTRPDVFRNTTFIAFGPYKVLPVEWLHENLKVYFVCDLSKKIIDPFALKGGPENVQYLFSYGLDRRKGILTIDNVRDRGYTMFIDETPLEEGYPELHSLSTYVLLGKQYFKRVSGGTRKKR